MSAWDRFVTWLKRFRRKPEPKPPPPEPTPEPEPVRVMYGNDVVTFGGEDVTYGLPES